MALVPSLFTSGMPFGAAGDPFLTLHREMNRLFDDVMRAAPGTGQGSSGSGVLLAPHIDVTENDNEVRIQAELPGVDEKDVELSLNDDVLTLRAEKKQEQTQERQGVHFSERSYGTFQRSLRLPYHAEPDRVQARFENGVLTVTLPKAKEQARNRRIQVQGPTGSGSQQQGAASVTHDKSKGAAGASGNGSSEKSQG